MKIALFYFLIIIFGGLFVSLIFPNTVSAQCTICSGSTCTCCNWEFGCSDQCSENCECDNSCPPPSLPSCGSCVGTNCVPSGISPCDGGCTSNDECLPPPLPSCGSCVGTNCVPSGISPCDGGCSNNGDCAGGGFCSGNGCSGSENCGNCPDDCGSCTNPCDDICAGVDCGSYGGCNCGGCSGSNEHCSNNLCVPDVFCGNGTCDTGECGNCGADCAPCADCGQNCGGTGTCGNGTCDAGECSSCLGDCAPCADCGQNCGGTTCGAPGTCNAPGCNCYETPLQCGGPCGGYQQCGAERTCSDGVTAYRTYCTPNCSDPNRDCYDTPSCVESDCRIEGCPFTPDCGVGTTPGCGVAVCAAGGNCFTDCSACDYTPPPSGNWECDTGLCGACGLRNTDTGACSSSRDCCEDPPPPPPPGYPDCTGTNLPDSITVLIGQTESLLISPSNVLGVEPGESVSEFRFAEEPASSYFDISSSIVDAGAKIYRLNITGLAPTPAGVSGRIVVRVRMSNSTFQNVEACSDAIGVVVTSQTSWWQVKDADVVTKGSLKSLIPPTTTCPAGSGGCEPYFDLVGPGGRAGGLGYPGVPIYAPAPSSYDFTIGSGTGDASEYPTAPGWLAQSTVNLEKQGYDFFISKLPETVNKNIIDCSASSTATDCVVGGGTFASGGNVSNGYIFYFLEDGKNLVINGPVNFPASGGVNPDLTAQRKVVLFVKDGNLRIEGKIDIANRGKQMFMAIIDGDISINPSVGHAPNTHYTVNRDPDLEGLFIADGDFTTGVSDQPLHIRGSVISYGSSDGIKLERDLASSDDTTIPAELVEFAPELLRIYPNVFNTRKFRWREVAP